jgi:hypothetical protein
MFPPSAKLTLAGYFLTAKYILPGAIHISISRDDFAATFAKKYGIKITDLSKLQAYLNWYIYCVLPYVSDGNPSHS